MDAQKGIIVWLLGGAGSILLYSAVKNVSPVSLIQSWIDPNLSTRKLLDKTEDVATTVNKTVEKYANAPGAYGGAPNSYVPPKALLK